MAGLKRTDSATLLETIPFLLVFHAIMTDLEHESPAGLPSDESVTHQY
jgi:hypothetical protein